MKFFAAVVAAATVASADYLDDSEDCLVDGSCTEQQVDSIEDSAERIMLLQMQQGEHLKEQMQQLSEKKQSVEANETRKEAATTVAPSQLQDNKTEIQADVAPAAQADAAPAAEEPEKPDLSLASRDMAADAGETIDLAIATDVEKAALITKLRSGATSNETFAYEANKWGWQPAGCTGLLCMGDCPITSNPTSDGGCCAAGTVGTGQKTCVTINSNNLLKYACGLSGTPSCTNEAGFFSNKDEDEVCELDGQKCTYIKYGWWSRHLNLFGGNKQDELKCTCGDIPVYRRAQDGPWVNGR